MSGRLMKVGIVCMALLACTVSNVMAGGEYSFSFPATSTGTQSAAGGQLQLGTAFFAAGSGTARNGVVISNPDFVQLDASILQALGVTLSQIQFQNPDTGATYNFFGSDVAGDLGVPVGSGATFQSGDWPKDPNGQYYQYLGITCNGNIKITIIVVIVVCQPCTTTTSKPTGPAPPGGNGDPQFFGLQHQNFQFHGMADEVFSLISSPDTRVNSLFKYISSGTCDYNDTVCWTHPGTYLNQIGISFGGQQRILLESGSHSNGMRVYINDKEMKIGHRAHHLQSSGNQSSAATILYRTASILVFETDTLFIRVINSDYFFNFDFGLKDSSVLVAGTKELNIKGEICEQESSKALLGSNRQQTQSQINQRIAQTFPDYPLHGLVGQTWRNAVYCGRYYQGTVDDYVTQGLFTNPPTFNYFTY